MKTALDLQTHAETFPPPKQPFQTRFIILLCFSKGYTVPCEFDDVWTFCNKNARPDHMVYKIILHSKHCHNHCCSSNT